jgi:carbon storage regulator CsrA
MLRLKRKINQKIIIGNDIEIIYLGCDESQKIELGFKAPESISIYREEIYKRISPSLKKYFPCQCQNNPLVKLPVIYFKKGRINANQYE